MKSVKYIGLDVHKKMIAIAIADAEGEVRSYGMIACSLSALDRFCRQQVSSGCELRFVYEAGPCGYGIYRHLRSKGFHCEVVSLSQNLKYRLHVNSKMVVCSSTISSTQIRTADTYGSWLYQR
jgi:transposase